MTVEYNHAFAHKHNAKTHTPAHQHSYYELVYYISGTGKSRVKDKTFSFSRAEMLLYPPDCVHDETHTAVTEVYCICFTSPSLNLAHTEKFKDDDGRIHRFVDGIRDEIANRLPYYEDMISNYISRILISLLRKSNAQVNYSEKDEMLNIANFINENLPYKLNISTITDMSGYSYDYFRHVFKKYFGVSPKKYLTDCQIKKAKELLTQTSLPVSAIAENCGFNTQDHFSVFFKKQVGISPLHYRNENNISM